MLTDFVMWVGNSWFGLWVALHFEDEFRLSIYGVMVVKGWVRSYTGKKTTSIIRIFVVASMAVSGSLRILYLVPEVWLEPRCVEFQAYFFSSLSAAFFSLLLVFRPAAARLEFMGSAGQKLEKWLIVGTLVSGGCGCGWFASHLRLVGFVVILGGWLRQCDNSLHHRTCHLA